MVVDTSVAYKWVRSADEESVPEALALLDAHSDGTLLLTAPALLPVELANALRYSGLDEADMVALAEEFDAFGIELIEADSRRIARAVRLALRHRLSVYDALFLQLAEELGCPLVTADRRAFAGLSECGVRVQLL